MADKTQKEQEQLFKDYRATFGSDHGKRVLADLFQRCHVYQPSFTSSARGFPELTAFREGERNVALQIMAIMYLEGKDLQEIAETE